MNILWYDGFEHYRSDPGLIPNGVVINIDETNDFSMATQGLYLAQSLVAIQNNIVRTGGYSLLMDPSFGSFRRALGGSFTNLGVAFGLYLVALPSYNEGPYVLAQFREDDNNSHTWVKISSTGRIIAGRSAYDKSTGSTVPTVLGTSTLSISAGSFNHFDIRVKISDSSGFFKIRVNGRDYLSLTGINTGGDDTLGVPATQIAFGNFDGRREGEFSRFDFQYLDDLIVASFPEDGSEDTKWICGDTGQQMWGAYYLKPNADTAVADWSLTTGVNGYALINEIEPHDDTAFIFSDTATDKSAFDVEPLPANITQVSAVMVIGRVKKTDTGSADAAFAVISDTTEDIAADFPLVTNYAWSFNIWQTDPHSSAAWDPTNLPSIEVERTA